MLEISLANGLGPIRFGMTPCEVKSVWGDGLHYEDWMGGNLENFLYYKGLLVGFQGEIDDCPSEQSNVCMYQVKTAHRLSLWGQEITDATKDCIEVLLSQKNEPYQLLPNGIVQCTNLELQFKFNDAKELDEVYFARQNPLKVQNNKR